MIAPALLLAAAIGLTACATKSPSAETTPTLDGSSQIVNPMKQVTSSEEFKQSDYP